jgi:hypothetical protein
VTDGYITKGGKDLFEAKAKELGLDVEVVLPKHMTNGDKIRQMNDEELAEWSLNICNSCVYKSECCTYISIKEQNGSHDEGCKDGILAWLKSEVKA